MVQVAAIVFIYAGLLLSPAISPAAIPQAQSQARIQNSNFMLAQGQAIQVHNEIASKTQKRQQLREELAQLQSSEKAAGLFGGAHARKIRLREVALNNDLQQIEVDLKLLKDQQNKTQGRYK